MLTSQNLSISIERSFDEVYDFAHRPENFSKWAAGLANGLHPRPDGSWVAETPLGHLDVQFSSPNGYGVLDHTVFLPTGSIYVPLRLIRNGSGCDLVLTLFRSDVLSDEQFNHDLAVALKDLSRFKKIVEDGSESVVHVDFSSKRR